MSNKGKNSIITSKPTLQKRLKKLVRTKKDWLEQKRTSKDGKGLVRTEKDY